MLYILEKKNLVILGCFPEGRLTVSQGLPVRFKLMRLKFPNSFVFVSLIITFILVNGACKTNVHPISPNSAFKSIKVNLIKIQRDTVNYSKLTH